MKIRIDEVGYEHFTGQLGLVQFVDGISVNEVSVGELNRMSAIIRIVNADTDKELGAISEYAETSKVEFKVEGAEEVVAKFVEPNEDIPSTTVYTKEQLEALADKEGITGLREIADAMNIKGTSITGLINGILGSSNNAPKK